MTVGLNDIKEVNNQNVYTLLKRNCEYFLQSLFTWIIQKCNLFYAAFTSSRNYRKYEFLR